jgi:MFS family permease
VDSRALSWVFSIYVLFHLVGAPLLAKWSDRSGRRSVYVASLSLFAVGSVIVASSFSFATLLAGRAVQAFGAGGIFPVASAVIGDTFPAERRGRALGMIGAVFGVAFLLGPLLGGVLLRWGWQWLFLINVPFAGLIIWQAVRVLPSRRQAKPRRFDALGAGVLTVALASLAWGVNHIDVSALASSVLSLRVLPFLAASVVAAPLFWLIERRAHDPVLHPELFDSRQLRLVGVIAVVTGLSEAGMVFLPSMAVAGLHVRAAQASFMMLPLVLTLIVGAPAAGRLLDRLGAKHVIQGGLLLTLLGLLFFALPSLTIVSFFAAGACVGLGLSGLLGAPLRYVVIQETGAARRGAGQGLLTLCLSVGQLTGGAVVGGVAAASAGGEVSGYQHALLTLAVVTGAALLVSTALKAHGTQASVTA